MEDLCIKIKDKYEDKYLCSNEWFEYMFKHKKLNPKTSYEVLAEGYIQDMQDLIRHALTYNYDIILPKGYKVTPIYNIIFTTANFDPKNRALSTCNGNIIYSNTNLKYINKKFKWLYENINKPYVVLKSDKMICWHTEDYAYNQIIHAYNIEESYIIEKEVDLK